MAAAHAGRAGITIMPLFHAAIHFVTVCLARVWWLIWPQVSLQAYRATAVLIITLQMTITPYEINDIHS